MVIGQVELSCHSKKSHFSFDFIFRSFNFIVFSLQAKARETMKTALSGQTYNLQINMGTKMNVESLHRAC